MSVTGITASNPYSNVNDLLSNVRNFKIIESTLREGEQFANAYFSRENKIKMYVERDNAQSREDCEAICKLGLKAKILTHTRCTMEDAKLACDCGVDGVDVVIGTSQFLRTHSLGGRDMKAITKQALEVIEYIKSRGCEVRFSSEDSFRSDLVDLLSIYRAASNAGVGRVGVADTVGCASPRQVYDLVRTLRGCVNTDIEVHFHDDTGCAVANSFTALEAGATRKLALRSYYLDDHSDHSTYIFQTDHRSDDQYSLQKYAFRLTFCGIDIDTSVLGIGERNGICPLGALMARMMPTSRDYILSKYKVHQLKAIEDFVAETVEINVPFNNPITGFCAFTHKAGIHAKAILNDPSTYEILKPEDFGLSRQLYRYVHFTSRLTGWNAIKSRVDQLGLKMTDDQIKEVTAKIKQMADLKVMTLDESDALIRSFHLELTQAEAN
ncbi:homocitrate synthase, mitochondrial [Trichoderma gamsii]|uniref:Homocitrate synthase, mitochondrial n=3 Tax=Trichoderma gamsii TaxID=398673 RepID=A0A2P4ZWZ6_9HYPO|nr:homocitrate synthase, mitochondrial [Trichoderma gamsii]PON28829.1 homocitrate synthase, mitochondrial [Trichoderma gamsii]